MLKKTLLQIMILIAISAVFINAGNENSVETLSRYGSRGDEVKNIQTRLKNWGYYKGSVDGIYGTKTKEAVMDFQRKNGLKVDGIAGPQTLAAIGLPTGTASTGGNYNSNDRNLLARIINAESRGEPFNGQVAVGAVVLNRVKHPSFPNSIAAVVYQPGAFTAVTDGQINASIEDVCYRAADMALSGVDPSGGAIYYYNPAKTTNQWIYSRPVVITIGTHVFAK